MITHFRKNGTEIKEIAGYIVRRDDVPQAYDMIEKINQKGTNDGGKDFAIEKP